MAGLEDSPGITIGGVKCWDEEASEEYTRAGAGGAAAFRTIACLWEDRIQLMDALFGKVVKSGSTDINTPPILYPDNKALVFNKVKAIGVDGDVGAKLGPNGMRAYKYCRLTIEYRPVTMSDQEGGIGIPSIEFEEQVLSIPHDGACFKWLGDSTPIMGSTADPYHIGIMSFAIPVYNISTLPYTTIANALQCVNSSTFQGLPMSCVKFIGATSNVRLIVGSQYNFDLLCRFKYRTIPWNAMYRPKNGGTGGSFEPFVKMDGTPLYPEIDLNALLKLGNPNA